MLVEHYETIDNCPAYTIIMEGNYELAKDGFASGVNTYFDDKVIAVIDDNKIVAVMTYRKNNYLDCLWISIAYIKSEYRGKGLYSILYEELKTKAKEEKVKFIKSGTHKNNIAAQKAFAKAGRTMSHIEYTDIV